MAEQINIFVENRPGRLKTITGILADSGINLRAIVIADREAFGIIKVLVDNPRKAHLVLTKAGFACATKNVLAIVIDDKPGGLASLAASLSDSGINIVDAYGFVIESKKQAVLCVEVKDEGIARGVVEANGFRILADSELYDL